MKKDNSTYRQKVNLRTALLQMTDRPVVMETHGGNGKIYHACYRHIKQGIVFEKMPVRIDRLAVQRPTWSVYEGDSERLVAAGVGAHLAVNFLDIDPYGDPFPFLSAFLASDRPKPKTLYIAVNDGLRHKAQLGGAWSSASLQDAVLHFGNTRIFSRYLDVCEWLVKRKAAEFDYILSHFRGYYCGANDCMTHYMAVLEQR